MNSEIAKLLEGGYDVFSTALGRVGKIESVTNNRVYLKSVKGFSAETTFDRGDSVEIIKVDNEDFDYIVCNKVETQ